MDLWILDNMLASKVGNEVDVSKICLRMHPNGAVVEFSSKGRLEEMFQLQSFDGSDEFEAGH